MKSILNDVNRLEKGWDLFAKLTEVCNQLQNSLAGCGLPASVYDSLLLFTIALTKSNSFIEKYGNDN